MTDSRYQLAVANWPTINDDCTNLQPNSTICLGDVGEDCQTTYVVKLGDTCDGVSYAAGINDTILVLNNPQIDQGCSNLYVGEVGRLLSLGIECVDGLSTGALRCI